jgi:hypothetical protein
MRGGLDLRDSGVAFRLDRDHAITQRFNLVAKLLTLDRDFAIGRIVSLGQARFLVGRCQLLIEDGLETLLLFGLYATFLVDDQPADAIDAALECIERLQNRRVLICCGVGVSCDRFRFCR